MATKKCANGHLYDPAIYGDKCPFCPSSTGSNKVNTDFQEGLGTKVLGGDEPKPTETIASDDNGTILRSVTSDPIGAWPWGLPNDQAEVGVSRRLVGLLVSYSANPTGEVYKVYEGRTTIGRDCTCDIPFPNDPHMSSKHLLIQYVEAKGAFRAQEYDKGSSNGSYVNGQVYVLGDVIELKNNDVIVIGGTKFIFLAIPEF